MKVLRLTKIAFSISCMSLMASCTTMSNSERPVQRALDGRIVGQRVDDSPRYVVTSPLPTLPADGFDGRPGAFSSLITDTIKALKDTTKDTGEDIARLWQYTQKPTQTASAPPLPRPAAAPVMPADAGVMPAARLNPTPLVTPNAAVKPAAQQSALGQVATAPSSTAATVPVAAVRPATTIIAATVEQTAAGAFNPTLVKNADNAQSVRETVRLKQVVRFSSGKSSLDNRAQKTLADLLDMAKDAERIIVRGHTDSTGSPSANQALARSRAAAVRSELLAVGIPKEKIQASYLTTSFVATNDTEEGRRENRRVEIELVMRKSNQPAPAKVATAPSSTAATIPAAAVKPATPIIAATVEQTAAGAFNATLVKNADDAQSVRETVRLKQVVHFSSGKSSLDNRAQKTLADLLDMAKDAERIIVRGRTDSTGSPNANQALARSRAAAVCLELLAVGIPKEKIQASYLTTSFVATNDTEEGRRENRRVEIELVMRKPNATALRSQAIANL